MWRRMPTAEQDNVECRHGHRSARLAAKVKWNAMSNGWWPNKFNVRPNRLCAVEFEGNTFSLSITVMQK